MGWACVHTYSGREFDVVANLSRKGLRKYGPEAYDTFCPQYVTTDPFSPALSIPRPLFPGYVFVQLGPDDPWTSINSTYGVIRLLTTLNKPLFISEASAENFKKVRQLTGVLTKDAIVQIKQAGHPFYDMEGVIVELTSDQRIKVMMSLFNRDLVVEFTDPNSLRVINHESK